MSCFSSLLRGRRGAPSSHPLASLLLLLLFCLLHPSHVLSLPPIEQMSSADVNSWLQGLSLSQYSPLFSSNQIDGSALPSLSAADLQSIGIDALGHRKKILKAIEQLRASPSSSSPAAPSPNSSARTARSAPAAPNPASTVLCEMDASGTASCDDKVYLGVRSANEDTSANNW